jgi:dihydrofolate reductase
VDALREKINHSHMRKLKIIEHISLDGVIQTASTPEDDFPYGDWTAPYRTPAGLQIVTELYGKSFDLLLGRRTYDILANFWPKAPKSPLGDRLNAATKFVVTRRPEHLPWTPCEAVGGWCRNGFRDGSRGEHPSHKSEARAGPDAGG